MHIKWKIIIEVQNNFDDEIEEAPKIEVEKVQKHRRKKKTEIENPDRRLEN